MNTYTGRDRILKLRAPAGVEARHRLRARLEASDLHPVFLPRSAILLLRHLRVAAPSRQAAWPTQLREKIEQAARSAAWPAREVVGAACNAVIFADEAELLSCLALDGVEQRLGERWWWPLWRAPKPLDMGGVAQSFIDTPRAVPAALRLLDRRGQLQSYVHGLPRSTVAPLIEAVARAYAAPELAREALTLAAQAASAAAASAAAATGVAAVQRSLASAATAAAPSTQDRRALLRWALERLAHALAGQAPIVTAADAALSDTEPQALRAALRTLPPVSVDAAPTSAPEANATGSSEDRQASHAMPLQPKTASSDATQAFAAASAPSRSASSQADDSALPAASLAAEPALIEALRGDGIDAPADPVAVFIDTAIDNPPGTTPKKPAAKSQPCVPAPSPGFVSEFAGLFYLLNVAQTLGLYGDFTMPRHTGLALSPWALLALIARRWFAGDALRADPLWPLLLELAGCDTEADLGRDFQAPNWTVPSEWLAAFGDLSMNCPRFLDGFGGSDASGSFHPTFWLQDERTADTAEQARRRWLMHFSRYLQARLARAFGGALSPAEVRALCVRHRAHVELGATELRLRFALADLPLPIRYAGLDRDIGWMPAAGLSIYFEYT